MTQSNVKADVRAFSIPEACQRLGISRSSIWKYAKLGKIKLIRIGGRTLAPSYEVERLLSEGIQ
jgi:excisionase family DNA binding protein